MFKLRARYPGMVKEVRKRLDEAVAAGDVVLVVEANDSLQRYNVAAPSAGVVVHRDVNPGMVANDQTLVTVADLTTVWVELAAFQHDLGRSSRQCPLVAVDGHETASGVSTVVRQYGRRQVRDDRQGNRRNAAATRPGLFVTGELVVAESGVAMPTAVQGCRPSRIRPLYSNRSATTTKRGR